MRLALSPSLMLQIMRSTIQLVVWGMVLVSRCLMPNSRHSVLSSDFPLDWRARAKISLSVESLPLAVRNLTNS